jgi:cation diffusion facilitator family transporter
MAASDPPSRSSESIERSNFSLVEGSNDHNKVLVYHSARGAVVWALIFNLIIAGLKLLVASFTRSAALFSEGLHSLADAFNSVTLLVGITRGNRAPDRTHPFGYGLETNLWALTASFVLLISALWSIHTGVERMQQTHVLENYGWAVVILIISIILEILAVQRASQAVLQEVGVEAKGLLQIPKAFVHIRQVVGPTTRFVFYEDVLALLGAMVALTAVLISEFAEQLGILTEEYQHWPDAIGSIVIGLMLLVLAVNLFRYNRGFLTGSAAPAMVENKIEEMVLSTHGVSQVCDMKTIDQGISGLIVHMTVEVDPDTQVKDVDDLTERIKERLSERFQNIRSEQVFIEVLADESEDQWRDHFEKLVSQGLEQGVLKPREEAMLRNVYDFTESVVRDVMIPRTDVEYVDVDSPLAEVAELMIETGHSRLPVYKEHVDNIVGMVHSRDVFELIRNHKLDTPLATLIREIDIYPENKPVTDLLEDFKRKKIRMAVVADEHGGFSGVVTIEDLMEEIIGEIWDEDEPQEKMLTLLDPKRMLVNGKCDIDELNERFRLNIPIDEFKTIGGFVFGTLGREPEQGDKVTFEELVLTVTEIEGPRIVHVMIESPIPFEEASNWHEDD